MAPYEIPLRVPEYNWVSTTRPLPLDLLNVDSRSEGIGWDLSTASAPWYYIPLRLSGAMNKSILLNGLYQYRVSS